jgi:hypothetical protein
MKQKLPIHAVNPDNAFQAYELLTATGKDLDDVGEIYRVRRAANETDADYRLRIIAIN